MTELLTSCVFFAVGIFAELIRKNKTESGVDSRTWQPRVFVVVLFIFIACWYGLLLNGQSTDLFVDWKYGMLAGWFSRSFFFAWPSTSGLLFGWSVDWLPGCLIDRPANWPVGWLLSWLHCGLVGCLARVVVID